MNAYHEFLALAVSLTLLGALIGAFFFGFSLAQKFWKDL